MAKQSLREPRKFLLWLIFFIVITACCGMLYLAVQQDMRISANDPQIQMAEDTAVSLGAGQKMTSVTPIDIATSLASFLIIYNSEGQVIFSGAKLNDQTPQLPSGVFASVKSNGEQRFTWQPQVGVRIATVVVPYSGGYVLAGRSLREVEKRIDQLGIQVGVVWGSTVGIVTVLSLLL